MNNKSKFKWSAIGTPAWQDEADIAVYDAEQAMRDFGKRLGKKDDKVPMDWKTWQNLERQVGLNKEITKELPMLSAMASPELAYRKPESLPAEMYNKSFSKALKTSHPSFSSRDKMLDLRERAGSQAAGAAVTEVLNPSGMKDLLNKIWTLYSLPPSTKLEYPRDLPITATGGYNPKTRNIELNPNRRDIHRLDTIIHEAAHADVHNRFPVPGMPEGTYSEIEGTGFSLSPEQISQRIKDNDALALAAEFSGRHFNNQYAVPSLDVGAELYRMKMEDLGKQRGYDKTYPEKSSKFMHNPNMTRIMRWLSVEDKK